jgi:signal transduction histidine kinase
LRIVANLIIDIICLLTSLKKRLTYVSQLIFILQQKEKKESIDNTLFSRHIKGIGIISTILIIVMSYSLFFYLQNITEENVKNSLIVEQRDRQIESTKAMGQHISSDLHWIMSILQGLSDSIYLQQGELYGDRVEKLMSGRFDQINAITKVDGLFIADKDDIITYNIVAKGQRSFVNIDISFRDYVQKTRDSLRSVFSNGFEGIDSVYKIALTFPIINRESGQYIGMVGVEIPTIDFFARYANVYDVNSKFLVAYDSNANYIATPRTEFLGKSFFNNEVQEFFNYSDVQNDYYRKVFAGQLLGGFAIYDFGSGERLNTGYPISVGGEHAYFIFIITPTSMIYSHINEVLFIERLKMFSLIAGTTAAVLVLIILLIKWNNILNKEVKRRTKQLEETNKQLSLSNQQLALANEQLQVHDKLQKEFINIASHEMKTPTQAILGFSHLLQTHPEKKEEIIHKIKRNAVRLQRLTNDILDVTRIESQTLKLNKQQFNLNQLISDIVEDYRNQISNANVLLIHKSEKTNDDDNIPIFLEADKSRLTQVISNLLDNAIKFTREGTISITLKKKIKEQVSDSQQQEAVIAIEDTGTGIPPEILPRLFSKFATESPTGGTGLGLFISKSIVEAHGGKIKGENYSYNMKRGARFTFSIPLSSHNNRHKSKIGDDKD